MAGLPLYACALVAAATSTSSFDPTTLSLTGYWRASYGGSPWSGTASAGTSGSNNLTEGTNPPATGAALNSYTPADFDGTNDKLTAGGTLDTYAALKAFSGWALVYCDVLNNNVILRDATITSSVHVSVTTTQAKFNVNSGGAAPVRNISATTWSLITWRYDGTNAQVGVNEAPGAAGGGSSVAYTSNLSSLANTVDIGSPSTGLNYFSGLIAEVALSDTALTDADFANVKSYINSRYGLSL